MNKKLQENSRHNKTVGFINSNKSHEIKLILCPLKDFRRDIGEMWRKRCFGLQGAVAVSMTKKGVIRRLFFADYITMPNSFRYMAGLVWCKITHIGYVDTSKNEDSPSTCDGVHDTGN
jgi:hypothetical protein